MKGEVLGDLALHMAAEDNVVTVIDDLEAGATIPYDNGHVDLVEDVPFGHKAALVALEPGDAIFKYGEPIGQATESIDQGEWVHTHNAVSRRGRGDVTAADDEEVA
jgi:SAF domain.